MLIPIMVQVRYIRIVEARGSTPLCSTKHKVRHLAGPYFSLWGNRTGAVVNDVPVARQSRDPALCRSAGRLPLCPTMPLQVTYRLQERIPIETRPVFITKPTLCLLAKQTARIYKNTHRNQHCCKEILLNGWYDSGVVYGIIVLRQQRSAYI